MMSRHFRLSSELTGAIAKRLPHAKNQLSGPGSFFNQFVTDSNNSHQKMMTHHSVKTSSLRIESEILTNLGIFRVIPTPC